ncbi:MAG: hydrogen peroxide-dependent heme synthase [Actinomycetota bacterium]
MTDETIYVGFPVFKAGPAPAGSDPDVQAKEVSALFDEWSDSVEVRGSYSTAGFRADADLMFWWVARSADALQDLTIAFRRTELGHRLEPTAQFMGLVRPAEFTPDHQPAFVKGKEPKPYLCIYPFVRTPEWYLLDPQERGRLLREHGELGRQFPDVWANTTSAFGLGDWEWILAFEADGPDRLVDLIRALRNTAARRYTKVEIPFFTGIRKDILGVVGDLS